MTIKIREEIRDIIPYKPGKPIDAVKKEFGLKHVIKLASNENPWGTSPRVIEKLRNSVDELAIYPDGNAILLKERISEKLSIEKNQILISNGSDETIDMIAKTYVSQGDEVILTDLTFPRYIATTKIMGGIPKVVPLKEWKFDLDGMLKAIKPKTKVIWLCNPNNPTGTMFNLSELTRFLDQVPENVLVVHDEAYREYVTREDYPIDSTQLLAKYKNLVVMRTFSKMYGLAGLRIGYTIADKEIINNINKTRGPFNVNTLAQIAALEALKDNEFIEKCYESNKMEKEYLYKSLEELHIEVVPTETNHIFANVKKDANEMFIELQKMGIIIRPMFDTWIRITIGKPEENKCFINALKKIINND